MDAPHIVVILIFEGKINLKNSVTKDKKLRFVKLCVFLAAVFRLQSNNFVVSPNLLELKF